ncbi:BlaI/MecI/CopY family transcriptional regulator [Enterococcus nangangensis]|uniref:BlaI/MecI/CopY family transcriptional regulator n=1 Tax=Enterococcus nangangensis TaxID=2559926 RepID=UPI0010F57B4F|nr:BlaI/MecI/CopY family transcriptional regulator [Enterococcus nangangensis]
MQELTKKERQIMNIFWNENKSLSANNIILLDSSLSKNTVQAVLRKLLKYKLIHVVDIGYSGTVLTRLYEARISQEEFVAELLTDDAFKNLLANYIENTDDNTELDMLDRLIQEKKQKLKKDNE